MKTLLKSLWNDERGFVVSAEIVLILTIGVLGLVVGISAVTSSVSNELNDIANAFGAADQSYWYSGMLKVGHSGVAGSAFSDAQDDCDCSIIVRTVPRAKFNGGRRAFAAPPAVGFGVPHRVLPPNPRACGGCPHAGCVMPIQLEDRRRVSITGRALVILADKTTLPLAAVHVIRLDDDGWLPLAAGFAVQLENGELALVSGATGLRLEHGPTIPLSAGAFLLPDHDVRIPLGYRKGRFERRRKISLTKAIAVCLCHDRVVEFRKGNSLSIGVTTLPAKATIRLCDGVTIQRMIPADRRDRLRRDFRRPDPRKRSRFQPRPRRIE